MLGGALVHGPRAGSDEFFDRRSAIDALVQLDWNAPMSGIFAALKEMNVSGCGVAPAGIVCLAPCFDVRLTCLAPCVCWKALDGGFYQELCFDLFLSFGFIISRIRRLHRQQLNA